jgi:hypothetical protein
MPKVGRRAATKGHLGHGPAIRRAVVLAKHPTTTSVSPTTGFGCNDLPLQHHFLLHPADSNASPFRHGRPSSTFPPKSPSQEASFGHLGTGHVPGRPSFPGNFDSRPKQVTGSVHSGYRYANPSNRQHAGHLLRRARSSHNQGSAKQRTRPARDSGPRIQDVGEAAGLQATRTSSFGRREGRPHRRRPAENPGPARPKPRRASPLRLCPPLPGRGQAGGRSLDQARDTLLVFDLVCTCVRCRSR